MTTSRVQTESTGPLSPIILMKWILVTVTLQFFKHYLCREGLVKASSSS